jgi:uncharacterized membrane protein YkvA (DUF1232 family)
MSDNNEFQENYSDDGFWDKLTDFAKKAGLEVVEKALLLYYAAQEKATPVWAKTAIYGSLGYFISPIDAIPDLTPVVGYSDDLGVLALAIAAAASYINDNVRENAATKLKDWFG